MFFIFIDIYAQVNILLLSILELTYNLLSIHNKNIICTYYTLLMYTLFNTVQTKTERIRYDFVDYKP